MHAIGTKFSPKVYEIFLKEILNGIKNRLCSIMSLCVVQYNESMCSAVFKIDNLPPPRFIVCLGVFFGTGFPQEK